MGDLFAFIVLPVFNGEKYILQQLMSIYYQSFKNWYLIIVNDGSTDKTEEIAKKFIENFHLEDKIKLLTKKNEGVNKAIESGLNEIKKSEFGERDVYVAYCDADDIRMRDKLEFQLNYIHRNNGDLCYHDLVLIDENDNIISNSYNRILRTPFNNVIDNSFLKFCLYNHITSTTMLFKYGYIEKIIPMCTGLYQDWYTSLIISGLNGKILSINRPLAYYRRHSNSMLSSNKKSLSDHFNEFIIILSNIKGRLSKDNREICDYMINYYETRLKYKKGILQYFVYLKYPKLLLYYLKSIISYLFG